MLTMNDLCTILHLDCYGPWHGEGSHMYMEFETHHRNQHMLMAKRLYLAINHGLDKVTDLFILSDD